MTKMKPWFWVEEEDEIIREQVDAGIRWVDLCVPGRTAIATRTRCTKLKLKARGSGKRLMHGYRGERIKRPALVSPSLRDLCWVAGFYEGEGTCGSGSGILVRIIQKNREPLHKVRKFFGGKVYSPNDEGISRWQASGPRARGFLLTIYVLLSTRRRRQVRTALRKDMLRSRRALSKYYTG